MTKEELEARSREAEYWGLTPEEASGPEVEIWPDNVQPVNVFIAMSTQWERDMGSPTGLKYSSLREVWQRLKVPVGERDEVFSDLRILEDAALEKMRLDRK